MTIDHEPLDAYVLEVANLDGASFSEFGVVFDPNHASPTIDADGWRCWSGYAPFHGNGMTGGIVHIDRRPMVVREMERHLGAAEWVVPHNGAIIQVVAPPVPDASADDLPIASELRAFRIPAGSAILMHPGTWHAVAFAESEAESVTYSFAVQTELSPSSWRQITGAKEVQVGRGAAERPELS